MNHSTIDRVGVSKLETLFAQAGWFFREQFIKDYGIDAQVETVTNGEPTGQLIAIQIKSGESYFAESDENEIVYRPDAKHVEYWLRHGLPVIIALYNPSEDRFFWTPVTTDTVEKTKKAYKITISKSSILTHKNCKRLKRLYKLNVPEYRLKRMLLDLEWMKLIHGGETVYAEFEDWVNKSLSRTSIKIFFDSNGHYKEMVIPTHYWAGHNSLEILEKFLPWADYEMDEEAHEEGMQEVYESECYGWYDKESGEVFYTEDFEDWYTPPDGIVPISQNGEVDTYRVILKLNELGETFLTISDYLYDGSSFESRAFSADEIV